MHTHEPSDLHSVNCIIMLMALFMHVKSIETEISSSKLNIIKWRTPSGEEKVLRLKKEMSVKWRELGQNVEVSDADLIGFRQSHLDLEDRMDAVTQKWIQNGSKNIKVK